MFQHLKILCNSRALKCLERTCCKVVNGLPKKSFKTCAAFAPGSIKLRRYVHATSAAPGGGLPEDTDYDIVPAKNVGKKSILSMLRRTFFIDEPLIKAVGLAGSPNVYLDLYCMECLDEDLSLIALPKSGVAPLGVCLNGTFMAKDIGYLEKVATQCTCKQTQQLFRFWAYLDRESELWNQYGVSRIFEIRILATDKRYRGRGIATQLVARSLDLARQLEYPLARMDCTSQFSAMAAKRLGMELAYSLKYSDYLTNNGRPIFDTPFPHNSATIFVQNLRSDTVK